MLYLCFLLLLIGFVLIAMGVVSTVIVRIQQPEQMPVSAWQTAKIIGLGTFFVLTGIVIGYFI